MKILIEKPPKWVWEQAHKQFEIEDDRTIYTYGDAIYNPAGVYVDEFLVAHESVHMRQQSEVGVEIWWKTYFASPEFRLLQEIEAYNAQYRKFCTRCSDRNKQDRYLRKLAECLAHPMYGKVIGMQEAITKIKNYEKN